MIRKIDGDKVEEGTTYQINWSGLCCKVGGRFIAIGIAMIKETIRGERMNNNGVSQFKNRRRLDANLSRFWGSSNSGSCSKSSSRFFPQEGQRTSVAKQAFPQLGQISSFFGENKFFSIETMISRIFLHEPPNGERYPLVGGTR